MLEGGRSSFWNIIDVIKHYKKILKMGKGAKGSLYRKAFEAATKSSNLKTQLLSSHYQNIFCDSEEDEWY